METWPFSSLVDSTMITASAPRGMGAPVMIFAAHPGCTDEDMIRLKRFASQELHVSPEQVQIYTPTPSTYSSLMYYTEMDPFTMKPVFVEKDTARKERQKMLIVEKPAGHKSVYKKPGIPGKAGKR